MVTFKINNNYQKKVLMTMFLTDNDDNNININIDIIIDFIITVRFG